jgi:MFS family permease
VYGPALKRLLTDFDYLALLVSMFLMSGAFTMVVFYSPPFLEKLGVARPWIGPIQAAGVIFEIMLFRWQPFLLRRFRITSLILVGIGALVVRHLCYAANDNLWLLSASYALVAVVVVFHHIGVSILANALAAAEVRATAQSLLAFCGMGLGPMFANALASGLTGHFNDDLRPVFLAGAVMAGLAGGVIAWRRHGLESRGCA